MNLKIVCLAIAATFPLSVYAQAAPVPTAIVPFGTLPTCAKLCGPLFDAQGACTPPTTSSVDNSCFCKYPSLQPFNTGTTGVCASVSGSCDSNDLTTIRNWFAGLCGSAASSVPSAIPTPTPIGPGTPTGTGGGTTSASASSVPAGGSSGASVSQTWLNGHWQYVVMIVVIVLGIIAIWIGACLWRRHRLRKKDLQYELRPPAVPWAENGLKAGPPYGYADGLVGPGEPKGKSAARYGITPSEVQAEKASRKKWVVKERT